jgi:hypothetical protein
VIKMALIQKDIRYSNRDFNSLKKSLIDFSKNYFPDTYQDFNETSPGMLFLEMAAYVGDVLSFYTDVTLQESMILFANERQNILNIAHSLGYSPKNRVAANTVLDVFQVLPAKKVGTEIVPDYDYAMAIEPGMRVSPTTDGTITFRTIDYIDFKSSSSFDPTEVTPYEIDNTTGEVTFWLLRKQAKAISGTIRSTTFSAGDPKPYDKFTIEETDIIEILYAIDTEGNKWEHVPNLAQDTLFEPVLNIPRNDKQLSKYRSETPYLLKLRKVPRRFTSRQMANGNVEIQFGAGISDVDDELLIPNPDLVGGSLPMTNPNLSINIDPSNFLYTKTYGLAPNNTTLTFFYTIGGGTEDNVPSEVLNNVLNRIVVLDPTGLDPVLYGQIVSSLAVTNPRPATGGKFQEDIQEIRQNAVASFAAQNRAVTKEDYIIRAYSLPSKYGSIAKAYITKDTQLTKDSIFNSDRVQNDLALNFYVLGYDVNGKLTTVNNATKENLKNYLNWYRILTDAINIRDAYIINIGVNFDIITLPDQNSNQVVLRCIDRLKQYFDVNKWQINQPIVISNIYTELDRVPGVQTVVNVKIRNLFDTNLGYSPHAYNIEQATKDGVLFPSLDPSIFEIKYPNNDIVGRARSFG